ncbi:hypothetical protein [Phocaeicola barnesiae]|nr:hypothetical protein [Phocaeicola barnesiae]
MCKILFLFELKEGKAGKPSQVQELASPGLADPSKRTIPTSGN